MATLRLVRAAERAGARRFVFFSAIGASLQSPTRFFRSKALAREAVESSRLETTVFSPSIVYNTPGDPWLTLLERLSLLPAVPVSGAGRALFQPIWAEDVADCVVASPDLPADGRRSFHLAGPEALSQDGKFAHSAAAARAPTPAACTCRCRWCADRSGAGAPCRSSVFATWEEAQPWRSR